MQIAGQLYWKVTHIDDRGVEGCVFIPYTTGSTKETAIRDAILDNIINVQLICWQKGVFMDKVIAICETENVYVKVTNDGYFKWYDSVSESTNKFKTIDDARENFIAFIKNENPELFVKVVR